MIDKKIKNKKNCTGCHGCFNICPSNCIFMESDEEGFSYPRVNYDKCIKCQKCVKVCPILNRVTVNNEPKAYACINKDEVVRSDSSSGGIFTLIAEQVLDEKGIVFGAIFDKEFNVVHDYVTTKEQLIMLRGSKYTQSNIDITYKKVEKFLKEDKIVLFSGTPCQIGGLKSFLQRDYDKLFCVDIICHGVPSPMVWRKYVSYREKCAGVPIETITFRNKKEGWKRYSMLFRYKDGIAYQRTMDKDLYMKCFLSDICLRPSCYECQFKTLHRPSDITLADFWGIQNVLPCMDDDKGTSLILVNSIKGQEMLSKVENRMLFEAVDINQAISNNMAAIKSAEYNTNREKFFYELPYLRIDKLIEKYCIDRKFIRLKKKIRLLGGRLLRKIGMLDYVKNSKK